MGVCKGAKWAFSSPQIRNKKQRFLENLKSAAKFRLIIHSCNDGLFAGMTLTLDKSQVRFSGIMQ